LKELNRNTRLLTVSGGSRWIARDGRSTNQYYLRHKYDIVWTSTVVVPVAKFKENYYSVCSV